MDPSVFFSYATEDRRQVDPYLAAFQGRGIGVWIDTEQIAPGQSIDARINKALDACRHAVIFHSASYAQKVWTQEEMNALIHLMVESNRPGAEQRTIFVVKLDPTELVPLLRHRLWTGGDPDRLAAVVADKLGLSRAAPPPAPGLNTANFLDDLDGVALEQLAAQLVDPLRQAPVAPPGRRTLAPFPVAILLRGYGRLHLDCMPRPAVDPDVDQIASILYRCGIYRRRIRGFQDQLARGGLGIYDESFRIALDEQIEQIDGARFGQNGLRHMLNAVILGARQI
jgi:hypothetical protein